MVLYDPGGAGCDYVTQFCNPGAQIQWYVNGALKQDTNWSGYNGSLGGYVATFRTTAPSSGSVTITAESANTVPFEFAVTATDQDAGIVSVSDVYCGNSPNSNASCDGANLIIYFYRNVVETGSGVAYVDLYIDGALRSSNIPTSSSVGGYDSYTIACPTDGAAHTILMKGKYDAGASVVLPAGGDPCLANRCGAGCPDEYSSICESCYNPPCGTGCPDVGTCACDVTKCGSGGSVEIIDTIVKFISDQPVLALIGAGAIAYIVLK
jgi:hypothetical protein